ncbi:MAG: hypothetical protein ACI9SX_000974 [Pseudoalteromonas tetraodonis]
MSDIPASQYTGTFSELLVKANLSLVITTYQAKKLVLLRAQGNQVNTHFINMERPMGLAYQNGRLSVGSGNTVIDYFNSSKAAAKIDNQHHHDGAFLHRRTHVTGDIDIHEMAFDNNNELWIVNTKMSCLCTLDVNYSFVPKWKPPFISEYDSTDRCHLNGLAMRSGKPRYVTALGTSDEAAGWRANKAFGGIVMDIHDNKIIASGLSMPHSPRWYQDRLWVLESGAGRLLTIDLETGEKTTIAEVPGFCRGMDFIGRYAVIGLSQIRETAMFAGLPLTKRKEDRRCGVWIVDLQSGESAGYLSFDTEVEEIFSVQCLPMKYPTLLEFDDKLLDTSYSVPASLIEKFVPAKPQQIDSDQAREYHQQGDYGNAIALYQKILQLEPENLDVVYNLGHALSKSGQWDKAITYIDQVIAAQDDYAQAWNVRGHFFTNKRQFPKAIENYDKAISIDQQYASAHYHKACVQLSQGNYKSGLSGYEWRTRMAGFKHFNLPHAKWQGEDIADKTLLVVFEANVDDAILFARYLAPAKDKCKRLIVACDEPLRTLFEGLDCIDEVRQHGRLAHDLFDVYAMSGSLGAILVADVGITPQSSAYLKTNNTALEGKPASIDQLETGRLKIGIVWSRTPLDENRSSSEFGLNEFLVLADIPGTDFYSVAHDIDEQEQQVLDNHGFIILPPEPDNHHQTAIYLEQMDFIICVPCVIAHLAGALNLPAVVVTSGSTDWRWAGDTQNNGWYPSVTVLRPNQSETSGDVFSQCSDLIIGAIQGQVKSPEVLS